MTLREYICPHPYNTTSAEQEVVRRQSVGGKLLGIDIKTVHDSCVVDDVVSKQVAHVYDPGAASTKRLWLVDSALWASRANTAQAHHHRDGSGRRPRTGTSAPERVGRSIPRSGTTRVALRSDGKLCRFPPRTTPVRAGPHRDTTAPPVSDPAPRQTSTEREGSRLVGEDTVADRVPRHRTLLRKDLLQRRQAVTNQVPLPVGDRNLARRQTVQSSTTSSMRSCAGSPIRRSARHAPDRGSSAPGPCGRDSTRRSR